MSAVEMSSEAKEATTPVAAGGKKKADALAGGDPGDHDRHQPRRKSQKRMQRRRSSRVDILSDLAAGYQDLYRVAHPDLKPFVGAQPKLVREPKVFTRAETAARTKIASDKVAVAVASARHGILVVAAQDSSYSPTTRSLLKSASDVGVGVGGNVGGSSGGAAEDHDDDENEDVIALGMDWIQCIPSSKGGDGEGKSNASRLYGDVSTFRPPNRSDEGQLLICLGTTSKYSNMCLGDPIMDELDGAYKGNNLVVITRSAIMLPIGTQEQNIYGADSDEVLAALSRALSDRASKMKRPLKWGHGPGTKDLMLSWAYTHLPVASKIHHVPVAKRLPSGPLPATREPSAGEMLLPGEPNTVFDHVADYVSFQNDVKLGVPAMPVVNYYDSGLCVSVAQKYALNQGVSLLMNRDGLAMNRDASIGHVLSKMNHVVTVEPYRSVKGVYNFFVGDGAMRLNGGAELALYLMGRGETNSQKFGRGGPSSFTTLFVFVNENWAVEDNLIQESVEEHKLYNRSYYELLSAHPSVHMCKGEGQLREVLCDLTAKQLAYCSNTQQRGEINVVLIADMNLVMPPAIFPNTGVASSPEVTYLRATLGAFAEGCELPVPLYGCSAYEYLQFLHAFMGTPEGGRYEYATGMTDIQASQLCGFDHPEGKCVLFINDVFGIHSLGETLRMNQSGLGDNHRQLIIYVWHPSLMSTNDHFQPHRPPCVWPSVSTLLAKFYVLKEKDACFVDFDGTLSTVETVKGAIASKTPLILINMLPEQERNYVQLDIRVKV